MWQNRITRYGEEAPDQLLANPKNWRTHPGSQTDALRGVLEDVGVVQNIIVNERTGFVVDGHARIALALKSGQVSVPITYVDLSEDEEALILATLDPLSAMAGTDAAQLDALLREVSTDSPALQAMLDELAQAAGIVPGVEEGDGGDDFDTTPDEGPTRAQLGDLWLIGGVHRLLVGDCTDAGNVARLMGGERAQLILTSPPYGVGMEYEGAPDQSDTVDLVAATFDVWCPVVRRDGFAFVNFGERYVWPKPMVQVYFEIFTQRGWRWYDQRFWKRSQVGMAIWNTTQPRALSQVEYLFTFQNGTKVYPVNDLSISKEQLWEDEGSSAGMGHPAVMALGVAEKAAKIYTQSNDVIAEPFMGSGTTLIAAHRTGRRCYGMEIEPRYADVILKRAEAEGLTVEKVG